MDQCPEGETLDRLAQAVDDADAVFKDHTVDDTGGLLSRYFRVRAGWWWHRREVRVEAIDGFGGRARQERLTYSVEELAGVLGLSRSKTYELVASGAIPAIALPGRRKLVARHVVDQLLRGEAFADPDS
jgi:excisionase family DNA binding protein